MKGRMEADSPESVASRLAQNGAIPVNIVAVAGTEGDVRSGYDLNDLALRIGIGKPSTADLIMLTRQLYTITKSGIPLLRGLRGLSSSTHNLVLRRALEDMIMSLEGGNDLASSFAKVPEVFSQLYVGMVAVGEATGTLDKSFLRLGQYLAQEQDIQDRVKGAVRYPAIVMVVIAAAMGVLTMFVIPKFAPLFRVLGDQIPWPTKVILTASELVHDNWQAGLGLAAAAVLLVTRTLRSERGRALWHGFKLRIPIVGKLMRQAILAGVMRPLSVSLPAGMPMLQTLATIARSTGNEYVASRIHKLREAV